VSKNHFFDRSKTLHIYSRQICFLARKKNAVDHTGSHVAVSRRKLIKKKSQKRFLVQTI